MNERMLILELVFTLELLLTALDFGFRLALHMERQKFPASFTADAFHEQIRQMPHKQIGWKSSAGKMYAYKPLSRTVIYKEKENYSMYDLCAFCHEFYHDQDRVRVRKAGIYRLFADICLIVSVGLLIVICTADTYVIWLPLLVGGNVLWQAMALLCIYRTEKYASRQALREVSSLALPGEDFRLSKCLRYAGATQMTEGVIKMVLLMLFCCVIGG